MEDVAITWRTGWTTPQVDRAARLMCESRCLKCGGNHATVEHGDKRASVAPPVAR